MGEKPVVNVPVALIPIRRLCFVLHRLSHDWPVLVLGHIQIEEKLSMSYEQISNKRLREHVRKLVLAREV